MYTWKSVTVDFERKCLRLRWVLNWSNWFCIKPSLKKMATSTLHSMWWTTSLISPQVYVTHIHLRCELSLTKRISKVGTFTLVASNHYGAFLVRRKQPLSSPIYWSIAIQCQQKFRSRVLRHYNGRNTAARLAHPLSVCPRYNVIPPLRCLQWLPMEERIIFPVPLCTSLT